MKFSRNYWILLQAQIISQLGTHIFNLARLYWIADIMHSGYLLGFFLMTCSLVLTITSPFAGYFADRHSRKSIIIWSDLIAGIAMICLTLMHWYDMDDRFKLIGLFVLSSIVSGATAFFQTAISATLPRIVSREDLTSANSLFASSSQFAQIFGQGFGGILLSLLGAPILFLLNGLSFLISGLFEFFLDIKDDLPKPKTEAESLNAFTRMKKSFVNGYQSVSSNKLLLQIVIFLTIDNILFVPIFVITPYLAKMVFQSGPSIYGLFIGSLSVGMLTGYFFEPVTHFFNIPKLKSRALPFFFFFRFFSFLILGWSENSVLSAGAFFIMGMSEASISVEFTTSIQKRISKDILGQVFGLLNASRNIGGPIAFAVSGIALEIPQLKVQNLFSILGVAALALVIWFLKKGGLSEIIGNQSSANTVTQ